MTKNLFKKIKNLIKNQEHDLPPLLNAMINYKKAPMTAFHIPGHNRGLGVHPKFASLAADALCVDTTGAIKEAQELAASVFGAKSTFFVTGGSTIANLALAFGLTGPNDEILVGRNCHRSVLTGLIITGAKVNWIIPKKLNDWAIFGAIEPECIEEKLKHNRNIKLVWITNPTYEGNVSDIKKIAEITKKYKCSLIVDEAHGSLWNFSDRLPKSALIEGADAVVHSFHKTAGAMTQGSKFF